MLWTLFDHGCLNPNLLNAVSQAGAHWISLWGQRLDSFVNWMYDLPLSQNLWVRFSPLHLLNPECCNSTYISSLIVDALIICVMIAFLHFFEWLVCLYIQATAQNTYSMWYLCTDVLGVHCYAWLKTWTGSPVSIWVLIKVHVCMCYLLFYNRPLGIADQPQYLSSLNPSIYSRDFRSLYDLICRTDPLKGLSGKHFPNHFAPPAETVSAV